MLYHLESPQSVVVRDESIVKPRLIVCPVGHTCPTRTASSECVVLVFQPETKKTRNNEAGDRSGLYFMGMCSRQERIQKDVDIVLQRCKAERDCPFSGECHPLLSLITPECGSTHSVHPGPAEILIKQHTLAPFNIYVFSKDG